MYHKELAGIRSFLQEDEILFRELGFDRDLFRISYEFTKPANMEISFLVTTIDAEKAFASEAEAQDYILGLSAKKIPFELTMHSNSLSAGKFYFPNRKTLEKYGVRGITKYPYPLSQKEMNKRIENLRRILDFEFELVGDAHMESNEKKFGGKIPKLLIESN